MTEKPAEIKMSKEEQIGFHKGSIDTLLKERNELVKMVNIVNQLLQMHLKALQDLGVKIPVPEQEQITEAKKPEIKKKPKDDFDF